jgi:DNA polymerase-4
VDGRVIAHVDMDAFFVSCELLRRPELRGRPVVVATGTNPHARGVVMAASYEAREFGVHSALPLAVAYRRCPQAVLIPRDIDLYRRGSRKVYEVLGRYADTVEAAGLDEAYLDLTPSPAPKARARALKREIFETTKLVASVGIAPNKLLAKIASDLDKPDGFCVLEPEGMLDAVGDRPASLIPGVGPKTSERLAAAGINTVRQLATAPAETLKALLGPKHGAHLRALANGVDERPLSSHREPKSESNETTFANDVDDEQELRRTVSRLAESVGNRLQAGGYMGRTVTLKIRLRPFRTYTRSRTLSAPTNDPAAIGRVAGELLAAFERDAPVRLLGVGVAGLRRTDAGGTPEPGSSLSLPVTV